MKHIILASTIALILTACNNGTPQNLPAASNVAASSVTTPSSAPMSDTAANTPILSSKDGLVSLATTGMFADKSNDTAFLPQDVAAENILFVQHDDSRNLTISAVNSGKVQGDAATFLANLKAAIEGNKALSNIHISDVATQRIAYHYTLAGKPAANESCTSAISTQNDIITVCAGSTDLSLDELSAIIAETRIGG